MLIMMMRAVTAAAAALALAFPTFGRLLWWRGTKTRRSPITPEEESGIATIPPA
ncbi:hypothetical protein ACFQ8S_03540 [Streptomyces virginiae]|uniref:hypothetical protein n=1 Tax=Streptomyces virginiae TaxID=1961 RepID=UPI0036AF2F98